MNTRKYTTTQIILDKKSENGLFENKRPIKVLNILELDNDVSIAFAYTPKSRKPFAIVSIYNGIACIIANDTTQLYIDRVHSLTSDMIINRYKELSII